MKTNRNEQCPCGSGKKYKQCCEKKRFQSDDGNKYIRWIISLAIGIFFVLIFWGIIEFFNSEHPEMEAYKCDNPSCNQIHYRPVSQSN